MESSSNDVDNLGSCTMHTQPYLNLSTTLLLHYIKSENIYIDFVYILFTECVEAVDAIQHNYNLRLLSVQECSDCCGGQPSSGITIFACIKNIGGLCTNTDYPYTDGRCHNNTVQPAAKVIRFRILFAIQMTENKHFFTHTPHPLTGCYLVKYHELHENLNRLHFFC